MNLVINGAEAIGEGNPGRVEIRTGLRELTAREIRDNFTSEALTPGGYVWLDIKDTGSGMDEETLSHIFDPLFSTKTRGLGLSLAIVKEVVELHSGRINVTSIKGEGTTFEIQLPLQ